MTVDGVVECYAGSRYPERPRAFTWDGQRLEVVAIVRQWRTPAGPVFDVSTTDSRRFFLSFDEAADVWQVRPVSAVARGY
jgi:hypothetical protein